MGIYFSTFLGMTIVCVLMLDISWYIVGVCVCVSVRTRVQCRVIKAYHPSRPIMAMWFMNDQHQLSQWNEIQSNQSDRIMCAVLFAPLLCQQPCCWIFFHQAKLSKSSTASTCARKPRRVAIQKMINMSTNSGLRMQHLQGTQNSDF